MITQTYDLNLIPDMANVIVKASQYDKEARTINFKIYNGKNLFVLPEGLTVYVMGTKPDGTGYVYECIYSGSTVSFEIQQQITVISGFHKAEIRLTKNGEILGTSNFKFYIEPAGLEDDTVISETDIPMLEEVFENIDSIKAVETMMSGGTQGQIIVKQSSQDGDVAWETPVYDDFMNKVPSATNGNIAVFNDGQVADSNTSVSSITNALNNKVDKVAGKGLSENDFTNVLKSKLDGIENGAEVNVQADWEQSDTSADDYIKNKPTLATVATSGSYADLSNKPTIPSNINDLSDVSISSIQNNQILKYNSTSSKWENANESTGSSTLSALTDVSISSEQNGQVLEYDSTSQKWKNANLPDSMNKVSTPTANDILLTDANGQAVDGGVQIDDIALTNGYYEEMTVGIAENLIDVDATPISKKFFYDQVGDKIFSGDAEIKKIKGSTVSFNQLCATDGQDSTVAGLTVTYKGNGIYHVSGTCNSTSYVKTLSSLFSVKKDHYYYIKGLYSDTLGSESTFRIWSATSLAFPATNRLYDYGNGAIRKALADSVIPSTSVYLQVFESTQVDFDFTFQMFDLTLMGIDNLTTVAEIEAWFSSHLGGLPYYAPTKGTLISFTGTGLKTENADQTESNTLPLPTTTYFPTGMKSAGSVCDELIPNNKAITRIGSRAYQSGDESDPTVITDGTTTYYPLPTPTETDISLDLTYPVWSGGTEQLLPVNTSTPSTTPLLADIKYIRNLTKDIIDLPFDYLDKQSLLNLCAVLNITATQSDTGEWTFVQN